MYYRTKEARFKKSMQNGKRKRNGKQGLEDTKLSHAGGPTATYDEAMVEHVRMVTSLIEGRKISRREVLEMLERGKKRQQGIPGEEKDDYSVRELTEDSS